MPQIIVLLPEESARSEAATEIVTLTDDHVTRLDEEASAWWRLLVDEESAGVARCGVGGEPAPYANLTRGDLRLSFSVSRRQDEPGVNLRHHRPLHRGRGQRVPGRRRPARRPGDGLRLRDAGLPVHPCRDDPAGTIPARPSGGRERGDATWRGWSMASSCGG
ncbi:MAG: hypothetical protein WKF50_10415 [Nocardioides sp.]